MNGAPVASRIVHSSRQKRSLIFFMSTLTSLPDEKASRAAEQMDNFTHAAADNLHTAASSVREGGRQGSKVVENLAESTADRLDGVGTYIEKHDRIHTLARSRQLVRRYPAELMAVAAGVGFLTGFAFRRLTHACGRPAAGISGV